MNTIVVQNIVTMHLPLKEIGTSWFNNAIKIRTIIKCLYSSPLMLSQQCVDMHPLLTILDYSTPHCYHNNEAQTHGYSNKPGQQNWKCCQRESASKRSQREREMVALSLCLMQTLECFA